MTLDTLGLHPKLRPACYGVLVPTTVGYLAVSPFTLSPTPILQITHCTLHNTQYILHN